MPAAFRIHGAVLTPRTSMHVSWHPDGVVVVNEGGRIAYCGSASTLPVEHLPLPGIGCDGLIIPGFIDCHIHLPQYDCRGMHAASLLEWLERYIFPEEERFADLEMARAVTRRFFDALARNGTTMAGVLLSPFPDAAEVAFVEAERSRLRVVMGMTLMDRAAPRALLLPPSEALMHTDNLIRRWHCSTDRLRYAVTPRFAPACSAELLRGAGELAARYGTCVQTHLNENAGEIALVRELFPDIPSYAAVYDAFGLLTHRTVCAHNVHADDGQLRLLAARGSAVAHCPESNLLLGSGRFPLDAHDDHGVRLGLATDIAAGASLSMFDAMRAMAFAQARPVDPCVLFRIATLGGAEAFSLQTKTGSLEEGKHADMIVVTLDDIVDDARPLRSLTAEDITSMLVHRAHAHDVTAVWVGGESVFDRLSERVQK
jgi:guanine deaminase